MHERSCIDSFLFSGQWSGDRKTHMCWAERTICDPMLFIHESFLWINVRINVSATLFLEIFEVKQTIGPRSNSRRQWFFLDKFVNSKCLVGLLGMGQDRLQRIMEGRWDKRRSWGFAAQKMCDDFFQLFNFLWRRRRAQQLTENHSSELPALLAQAVQRTARKRREVNLYLLKLYMDAAGMLPQKKLGFSRDWVSNVQDGFIMFHRVSSTLAGSTKADCFMEYRHWHSPDSSPLKVPTRRPVTRQQGHPQREVVRSHGGGCYECLRLWWCCFIEFQWPGPCQWFWWCSTWRDGGWRRDPASYHGADWVFHLGGGNKFRFEDQVFADQVFTNWKHQDALAPILRHSFSELPALLAHLQRNLAEHLAIHTTKSTWPVRLLRQLQRVFPACLWQPDEIRDGQSLQTAHHWCWPRQRFRIFLARTATFRAAREYTCYPLGALGRA